MILPHVLILAIDLHQPKIPLHFEPNQGQLAGETEWIAKARGGINSTAETLPLVLTALGRFTADMSRKRLALFQGTASPGSTYYFVPHRCRRSSALAFTATTNGIDAAVGSLGPVPNHPMDSNDRDHTGEMLLRMLRHFPAQRSLSIVVISVDGNSSVTLLLWS